MTPVTLGRAGARGLLVGLGVAAVALGLLLRAGVDGFTLFYAASLLLLVAATAVRIAGSTVRLDDDGLMVRRYGRCTQYPWRDVLEVSWRDEQVWGQGPVLRVRGGPYDVPGPNQPDLVARLPVYGRRHRERAVDLLRTAAERQGVPYDARMEQDIGQGRRRPRLPTDDA